MLISESRQSNGLLRACGGTLLAVAIVAASVLTQALPAQATVASGYDSGNSTWSVGLGYLRYQRPY